MDELDVPESFKKEWEINRLTRLAHYNPKLLPYYIQVVNDPGVIRKLYSIMETEKLKKGED